MLKIVLALFLLADVGVLILLIIGLITSIRAGGDSSVLLPSFGIIVSLPFLLFVLLVFEMTLVVTTLILSRYLRNKSARLN